MTGIDPELSQRVDEPPRGHGRPVVLVPVESPGSDGRSGRSPSASRCLASAHNSYTTPVSYGKHALRALT